MAKYALPTQQEEAEEEASSSSSSEEEDEEEQSDEEEEEEEEPAQEAPQGAGASGRGAAAGGDGGPSPGGRSGGAPRKKISLKLLGGDGSSDVCHVCGKKGHFAGFVGAVYYDCPSKPCYLCGQGGHSTMTCPFRVAPGHGCTHATGVGRESAVRAMRKRERDGRHHAVRAAPQPRWQVDAAVLKLHARRVTCLEFHPFLNNIVLSGDKHGQIAVWDFCKVFERTVYTTINRWLTNALRFLPGGDGMKCATSAYDGTVKVFDVETGGHQVLYNANGVTSWENVEAEDAAGRWVTMIGMDVIASGDAAGVVVAGDSIGGLHFLDSRTQSPAASMLLHKKGTKIQSVHSNPVDPNLLLTAGNDYLVRLLDVRNLSTSTGCGAGDKGKAAVGSQATLPAELAALQHKRVINAAYFSPATGRKILTTCQDNRLRVWDYAWAAHQPADREIVHSHTFNRHLTPFRAEWDPKDPQEQLIMCGRYISEDVQGVALHPVDIMDASTGALVGQLADPNLTTICPVNKPHPRLDLIVSGSSRSLYAWGPEQDSEDREEGEAGRCGGSKQQRRSNGAGASSSGRPSGLQDHGLLIFDADEDAAKKKKKVQSAKVKTPTVSPQGAAGSSAAAARASGGQRGKGKRRAAEEEEDGDESD